MTDARALGVTGPNRSRSKKAELQREIAAVIAQSPSTAGWTAAGFIPDLQLLARILALTDPQDIRGGSVATALDMWAAATLRSAGIQHVVPRAEEPFFISRGATSALDHFTNVDEELRALKEIIDQTIEPDHARNLRRRYDRLLRALKRARADLERGTTAVLGESRRKQVDVFVADWDRGLELLISTKSFALAADPSEIVKNLPNRWEEFDGDLKNLRGRFPLAAIGALTIVPSAVLNGTLPAFADMMMKLTAPGRPWVNGYDRSALIIVEPWTSNSAQSVAILNGSIDAGLMPSDLNPETFFAALLEKLLERSPIAEHQLARIGRANALGLDVAAIKRSAEATNRAIGEEAPEYDAKHGDEPDQ